MVRKTLGPIESLRKGILAYGRAHPERVRRFPRDAVVIRQGHISDFCYLIKTGTLGILVSGDKSEPEKEIALRYANEFIGETAFLQRGVPRTATVIVRSKDAVLVEIARTDLYSILAQDPSLHEAIAALWELSASRRRETAAVLGGKVDVRTAMMSAILADLHNFSGVGEVVWEEELDDFLFELIERCSASAARHEGTFEEQGDGFKAIFSGQTHADRAIRFAVEVRESFRRLRDDRATGSPPFRKLGLGIGVCTDFMSIRRRDGASGSRVLSHALNIAAAISKYRESVDEAEIFADPLTKQLCTLRGIGFGPEEAIPLEKLGRRHVVHRVGVETRAIASPHDPATSANLSGQVFVSYAHLDSQFVDALAGRLESDGIIVWRDNNEILVGDEIDRAISEGIQANRLFLIVLTPNSIESDWVARELAEASHEAVSGGKVILPVLTGGISPEALPSSVRRRKVVTFASDFEEPYRFLLRSIKEHSRRGRQPP